ncbi:MAG TPA: tetratricopeptide repeat protein [Acidobacteriaceae bacterium]
MDIQTQTARPSGFVKTGSSASVTAGTNLAPALSWFDANRAWVIRLSILAGAALLVALAATLYITTQSAKAESGLSEAMDIYDAPLRQAGQPVEPGVQSYATAAERARAANPLFAHVADSYGLFKAGANARYFAGLTAEDMGQTAQAEADLKKAAGYHQSGLSSLAKLALASLYRRTGRTSQAVDVYQQLIAKPTLTVPLSMARLELAETYEATRPEEARRLYALIKDQDKTSAAAQIASQKLEGKK